MLTTSKHYVLVMAVCFAATLLPILALNLQLGSLTLGNADKVREASAWQQATHGVTYAPTLSDTTLFKVLRLHDRLPEINGVVLGSSTSMGITAAAFPPFMQMYNFAQTGHGLASSIGEAEWLMAHKDNVKYLLIPLDWSIGFLYDAGKPSSTDLDAIVSQPTAQTQQISLMERVRDALSYPRIVTLFGTFRVILKSDDRLAAFHENFLQAASNDYRCPDGVPAKDFDIIFRGTCTGFRFDGSATFANSDRVKDARPLILSATTSGSQYVTSLIRRQGEPNPDVLRHLSALARQAEAKGGKLLLFLPPLLPGLEAAFFQHPKLSVALSLTKSRLAAWAAQENMVILDAGQSERYGCASSEFLDEHHATSSCYDKMLSEFWKTHVTGYAIIWPAGGLY